MSGTQIATIGSFAVLAACWSERPAPTVPGKVAEHSERSLPTPRPQPFSRHYAMTDAVGLAQDLREADITGVLLDMSEPIVALDLASGAVTTICGASLASNITNWTRLLTDANRNEPTCTAMNNSSFSCTQRDTTSSGSVLILQFANEPVLRLRAVVVGQVSAGTWALGPTVKALRDRVANASCP